MPLYAYDPEDVRRADERAIGMGISGQILMENAGAGAAKAMLERFAPLGRAVVLCGPGNNGGDGFVVARHLMCEGVDVTAISTTPTRSGDSRAAELMYVALGGKVIMSKDVADEDLSSLITDSPVIVDALLGTGSGGPPRGEVLRLVRLLGDAKSPVVSLDIPTGFDGRSGIALGDHVRASLTLTFLVPKSGLFFPPAFDAAGEVMVIPIGVPPSVVLPGSPSVEVFFEDDLWAWRPKLDKNFSKADRGMVLILGGSELYGGAPFLSALGALRAGAGLVVCGVPERWVSGYASFVPEAIVEPLKTLPCGSIDPDSFDLIMSRWQDRVDAVVLGPGIGRGEGARALVARVLSSWDGPLVLDADGLNALPSLDFGRGGMNSKVWITPHEGEAARLLDRSAESVKRDRRNAAEELGRSFEGVLLKGRNSVLVHGVRLMICCMGDPNMSIPGSGDVLSGIMGAIFARSGYGIEGAAFSVGLHALAGEKLAYESRGDGLLARELADEVAYLLGGMRS